MTAITRRLPQRRQRAATGQAIVTPRVAAGTAQIILWVVVLTLNAIGLAMVLSASSVTSLYDGTGTWATSIRQGIWFVLGLIAMIVASRIDYRRWAAVMPFAVVAALASLIVVILPGVGTSANGSVRWIDLGPLTVQPAELVKLALILYLAQLLASRQGIVDDPRQSVHPVMIVLLAVGVLLLMQPDLGSMILIAAIAFAMLFAGGAPVRSLGRFAGLAASTAVLLAIAAPYRRRRLLAFLNPWDDPLDTGYQTIQSLVGISSGGLMGVGIGEGRAKWGYLPFAHTDFIYSVVAEEMGFGGAVLVLGLFVVLAVVGCRVALHAPDAFGRLLVVGIVVWIVLQALVNIGAVLGTLPITGVPLPFVSFGGTSLLVSMAAMGVVLNVCRQAKA